MDRSLIRESRPRAQIRSRDLSRSRARLHADRRTAGRRAIAPIGRAASRYALCIVPAHQLDARAATLETRALLKSAPRATSSGNESPTEWAGSPREYSSGGAFGRL